MALRLRCMSCSREWAAETFAGAMQPRCDCGGVLLPRTELRHGRDRRFADLPVDHDRREGPERRDAGAQR